MKNGEAILKAAKLLGKELAVGIQAEYEGLKTAAERIKTEYKEGTLKDSVKQEFEKDKAIAEDVFTTQVANLEKEIQKLKEQLEQKKQASQEQDKAVVDAEVAADAEVETEAAEEVPAEEVAVEEVPAEAEAAEEAGSAQECAAEEAQPEEIAEILPEEDGNQEK